MWLFFLLYVQSFDRDRLPVPALMVFYTIKTYFDKASFTSTGLLDNYWDFIDWYKDIFTLHEGALSLLACWRVTRLLFLPKAASVGSILLLSLLSSRSAILSFHSLFLIMLHNLPHTLFLTLLFPASSYRNVTLV